MTDVSSTSTGLIVSMFNAKHMIISCPSGTATGDTIDMSNAHLGGLRTIKQLVVTDVDGNLLVDGGTFSGTVITFGTLTTGVHQVGVIGTT